MAVYKWALSPFFILKAAQTVDCQHLQQMFRLGDPRRGHQALGGVTYFQRKVAEKHLAKLQKILTQKLISV